MSGFITTERPDGILYWRFEDFRRATSDEWTAAFRRILRELDAQNGHFRCLVHFGKGALPTPYMTQEAIEAMKDIPPNLAMSVAMVSENKMMFNIVRFAMNSVSNIDYIRFFDSDEEGIVWLKERQKAFLAKNLARRQLPRNETQ